MKKVVKKVQPVITTLSFSDSDFRPFYNRPNWLKLASNLAETGSQIDAKLGLMTVQIRYISLI